MSHKKHYREMVRLTRSSVREAMRRRLVERLRHRSFETTWTELSPSIGFGVMRLVSSPPTNAFRFTRIPAMAAFYNESMGEPFQPAPRTVALPQLHATEPTFSGKAVEARRDEILRSAARR